MAKRILAGSIVALLVGVCSLGAACELSCSFAAGQSDCHLQEAKNSAPTAASADTDNMDMTMAGMDTVDMGPGTSEGGQPPLSAAQAPNTGHTSIGEMGPCERQSCDGGSSGALRSARSSVSQLHVAFVATTPPSVDSSPPAFPAMRDNISPHLVRNASPLSLSLRI